MLLARRLLLLLVVGAGTFVAAVKLPEQDSLTAQAQSKANEDRLRKRFGVHEVNPSDYLQQCGPQFKKDGAFPTYPSSDVGGASNYQLIRQKSGLCMDAFTCMFALCIDYRMSPAAQSALADADIENVEYEEVADLLPQINLPHDIAFPKGVKDVVDALKFAKRVGRRISVKTSGHSYPGSSMLTDSVNINLRSFPKYTQEIDLSITECDAGSEDTACKLALARGKKAHIRVGGGQLWSEVYAAVENWNRGMVRVSDGDQRMYEIMGGAAGTVGAAGGWLQGGGLGTGPDRLYGAGIDQVIKLEMILSSGEHVRFGPTEWESKQGFLYPQTVRVEGECNARVSNKEDSWVWRPCKGIPFQDLWKAVRGGGGGSFGIVTAVTYQLHPYRGATIFAPNFDRLSEITIALTGAAVSKVLTYAEDPDVEEYTIFRDNVVEFLMNLLWSPQEVGLDQDTSNACGSAMMGILFQQLIFCKDDGPYDAVLDAWVNFGAKPLLEKLPQLENISDSVNNLFGRELSGHNLLSNTSWPNVVLFDTFQPYNMLMNPQPNLADFGMGPDYPPPGFYPTPYFAQSIFVPLRFFREKTPEAILYAYGGNGGHLMGGNLEFSSDGMDSLTKAYRQAAYQYNAPSPTANHFRATFLRLVHGSNFSMTGGDYPGDMEYNHVSGIGFGPLKSNFEVPCNATTFADANRDCLGVAESTHGTKGKKWLEAVKESVDPLGLFQCHTCIGHDSFDKGQVFSSIDNFISGGV